MENNWYEQRNKRTDALEGVNNGYKNIRVAVIAQSNINQYSNQIMLLATVNILSRWCSQITILSPDAPNLVKINRKYNASFLETIKKIILENDPHIDMAINDMESNCEFCIYIGNSTPKSNVPYVNIDCNGWIVSCGYNHTAICENGVLDTTNPLSACFAACMANAEVFRWANGLITDPYVKWYSLYSMEISQLPLFNEHRFKHKFSLGRVHIIGCGAIGSSFVWLLPLTEWSGEITLADMDTCVELHNTSSSLLFTNSDVEGKKTKVKICFEYLQGGNLNVHEFSDDYGKYKYDHRNKQKSADLLLCFANDKNIWSTIQNLYPPVTFHATTSSSWGVNIGRHVPFKDECVHCTFQELMKVNYVPICAKGDMPKRPIDTNNNDGKPSAILPFLAPAAAILVMAKMHRMYEGQNEKENSLQMNFSTSDGEFLTDYFKPGNCPICRDQHQSVYVELNSTSLFWGLSMKND